MDKIKSFLNKNNYNFDGYLITTIVFVFFLMSQFLNYYSFVPKDYYICLFLGIIFCFVYSFVLFKGFSLFEEKIKLVPFALIACDFCVYSYFFNAGSVARVLSMILFCASLICVFEHKHLYITVIFCFISFLHTPSLTAIIILLLLSDCLIKKSGTKLYTLFSFLSCILSAVIHQIRVYSFEDVTFNLFHKNYLEFDIKMLLHILSFIPLIAFFAVIFFKSASGAKSIGVSLAFILPVIYSVAFTVIMLIAKNYIGPFFVSTVFICYFHHRELMPVKKTFYQLADLVYKHPVLLITLAISFSAFNFQNFFIFNSFFSLGDIVQ